MPLVALSLATAGFALFAGAHPRHRRDLGWPSLAWRLAQSRRFLAVAVLAASLLASAHAYGPYFGPVAWVGFMTLGALAVALTVAFLGARRAPVPPRSPR